MPLTTPLVEDLYWGCGAGLTHIELLTGQPAIAAQLGLLPDGSLEILNEAAFEARQGLMISASGA